MTDWGSFLRRGVDVVLSMLAESDERKAGPPPSGHVVRSAPAGDRAREVVYAPEPDGAADPGEIVWTWVPFEDDPAQGKDRPLLVVGRSGPELLGLMLSSRSHRADDANWVSIGTGEWDREGRGSYIRLDRVLEVDEHGIRREGAVLDRDRFDRVAEQLRASYGWR